MSKPRFHLRARTDQRTGYGQHAAAVARGFRKLGYHVDWLRISSVIPAPPLPADLAEMLVFQSSAEDWELIIDPISVDPTPGKKTAYFCMWESTVLPTEAVARLNASSLVIVPCQWNASCFSACGVATPIVVCPLGVDTDVFKDNGWGNESEVFRIGCACNWDEPNQQRKAIDEIVFAFFDLERTDVQLSVKTTPGPTPPNWSHDIEIVNRFLADEELARWYQSLDLFVCASRGAGWDMMLHQAMACGVSVAAPRFGGPAEYFAPPMLELPFKMVPASGPYLGEQIQVDLSVLPQLINIVASRGGSCGPDLAIQARSFDWRYANGILERHLIDCGMLPSRATPIVKDTPEERILRYYRRVRAEPKLPLPEWMKHARLTNTPMGLGDTMMLTDLPRKASRHGQVADVTSNSPYFNALMAFNPYYQALDEDIPMVASCDLIAKYDCGNGHTFQRLQRAFGFEPDLLPHGCIETPTCGTSGRVALHLEPGLHHAQWQSKHVHPRARQIYPRTRHALTEFIRNNPHLEFVNIGMADVGIDGVEEKGERPLEATIRLLSTCEYFIGILSGPAHLAMALKLKTVLIVNFPNANRIWLPCLNVVGTTEEEWLGPQCCVLHQESESPHVKLATARNLDRAIHGELFPFWSDRFLPLIHEKL